MEWSDFDSLERWLRPNVPPALEWWEELEEEPEVGYWWGDFANNNIGHGHEVAAAAAPVRHVQPAGNGDQGIKRGGGEEGRRLRIQSGQQHRPQARRPGLAWTEKEHKLFLMGLKIFGKGDWKSISRMCVKSKNPTQVASHAQKYFKRREMMGRSSPGGRRRRRRGSIHDTELDFSDVDSINALMPNLSQILFYAKNASTAAPSSSSSSSSNC